MSADRSRPPPDANSPAEATGLVSSGPRWFALSIAATVLVGTLAVFALVPPAPPEVDSGGPPSDLDSATGDLDTPLRIAPADITYMNRIFHERTHEIGYCGVIDDGNLRPWLADTVQSDPTSVDYVTDNCPADTRATLHTHLNGNSMLSKTDANELTSGPHDIMCIHAGQITTTPGDRTKNLRCYQHVQTDDGPTISERPIRVAQPAT